MKISESNSCVHNKVEWEQLNHNSSFIHVLSKAAVVFQDQN